jgi:hypothetical protein
VTSKRHQEYYTVFQEESQERRIKMRQVERSGLARGLTPWGRAVSDELKARCWTQRDLVRMLSEMNIFFAENMLSNLKIGLAVQNNLHVVNAINEILGIELTD